VSIVNSIIEQLTLVEDINKILENHGISLKLRLEDLTITNDTVNDLVKHNSLLSDAIVDYIWDNVESKEVFHYTTKTKAESILNSGFFRLYNLLKRFEEGEVNTFCISHNLNGYLEKDDNDSPTYKKLLINNMYYASFSDTKLNDQEEKYLKNEFSSFEGVRLKLKITATNKNFRKIVYEPSKGKPLPLLNEISTLVETKLKRKFILKGISRLCAFYLSNSFKLESEYRILFKYQEECGVCIKNDSTYNYIELPLGTMSSTGYMIEVLEVQTNEKLNISDNYNLKYW